jgi:hypothetical protein
MLKVLLNTHTPRMFSIMIVVFVLLIFLVVLFFVEVIYQFTQLSATPEEEYCLYINTIQAMSCL